MINQALIANDGFIDVLPNLVLDWEQAEAAQVTTDAFHFAAKGFMFDKRVGEVDSGIVPADMSA